MPEIVPTEQFPHHKTTINLSRYNNMYDNTASVVQPLLACIIQLFSSLFPLTCQVEEYKPHIHPVIQANSPRTVAMYAGSHHHGGPNTMLNIITIVPPDATLPPPNMGDRDSAVCMVA